MQWGQRGHQTQIGQKLLMGFLLVFLWVRVQSASSVCWAKESSRALHPVAAGTSLSEAELENRFQENGFVLDPNFTECGPTCLYQKSKENLSVQLQYVYDKKTKLEGNELTAEQKMQLLGSFCIQSKDQFETLSHCLDRWQKMTNFWFLKVRGALGESDTSIARLKGLVICDFPDGPNGKRVCRISEKSGAGFAFERRVMDSDSKREGDRYYHAPDISTANELARLVEESKNLMSVNTHTEQKNPELFKPECRDFIIFDTKPVNPVDSDGGSESVPRAGNGPGSCEGFVYDQAAFKHAEQKWKKIFQEENILGQNTDRVEALKQSKKNFIEEFKADPKDLNKSIARKIYDHMRDSSVAIQNQELHEKAGEKIKKSSLTIKKNQLEKSNLGDGTLAVEFEKVNAKLPGTERFKSFRPDVITFKSSKSTSHSGGQSSAQGPAPASVQSGQPSGSSQSTGSGGLDAVTAPDSGEDGTLVLDFD